MAEFRTGTNIETLTRMTKLAWDTAARGMQMLTQLEEIESNVDALAAEAGRTVEDVYRPLWEGRF